MLPSVYRTSIGTETAVPELLGQTLLEGMACEAPAICTDVASLPEIVEDGDGVRRAAERPWSLGDRLQMLPIRQTGRVRWERRGGAVCSSALRGTLW